MTLSAWPSWSPGSRSAPRSWRTTAVAAKEKIDPTIRSVVELYPDRIDGLDEKTLGDGPFRGVPFLIKDVFGHEKGRRIEFGSRLCAGMTVEASTYFVDMLEGVRRQHPGPLGGAGVLDVVDHRERHVRQYLEPLEARLCGRRLHRRRPGGGDGRHRADRPRLRHRRLDPHSRQLVAAASASSPRACASPPARWWTRPAGATRSNFVQTKTVRDAAAMLDCVSIPQPGDPFIIPKPDEPYASLAKQAARQAQGRHRARRAGRHEGRPGGRRRRSRRPARRWPAWAMRWSGRSVDMGGRDALVAAFDVFFFGFDARLDGYAKRSGHKVGPDTLEPVILSVYEAAKDDHAGALHRRLRRRQRRPPQARQLLHQVRHLAVADHVARGRALGPLSSLQARRRLRTT